MSAPLLAAIREAAAQPAATGHCFVAGLDLELQAADAATVRWAMCYLEPLIQAARQPTRRRYIACCLYSDQIVQLAIGQLQDIELVPVRRAGRDSYLRRARPAPHIVVYVDPDEGLLWVSDLASEVVTLVVSSRTKLPAMAFANLARELLTGYLAEQGWTLFHAGAVLAPGGVLMVIGYGGSGKTTLLLALMCGGLAFIANELLFVRLTGQGLEALAYPMAVAVGLGSAMQIPALAELIDGPDILQFPRHRLDLSRIVNTPRDQWPGLPDKLQLLPGELCALLQAQAPLAGGPICGLVVPCVNNQAAGASCIEPLGFQAARSIISDNHIGLDAHSRHRPWLALSFQPAPAQQAEPLCDALAALNPKRYHFGLSADQPGKNAKDVKHLLAPHG